MFVVARIRLNPVLMIILKTPRLVLRQFELDDAEATHSAVFGDPEVMRYGMGIKSLEQTRQWIEKHKRNYKHFGLGKWAAVLRDTNELIGYCGFTPQKMIDGRAEVELGYRLAQAHWKKGHAIEAATAARDHAFQTLDIPRFIALIEPANQRSILIAERLGMAYVKDVMLEGYTHPDRLYVLERAATTADVQKNSMKS